MTLQDFPILVYLPLFIAMLSSFYISFAESKKSLAVALILQWCGLATMLLFSGKSFLALVAVFVGCLSAVLFLTYSVFGLKTGGRISQKLKATQIFERFLKISIIAALFSIAGFYFVKLIDVGVTFPNAENLESTTVGIEAIGKTLLTKHLLVFEYLGLMVVVLAVAVGSLLRRPSNG